MKKTQKEKKKLLEEKEENQFLDYVRCQIKNVLENDPYMDEYLMFSSVMKVVPEYLSSGKWSEKTLDFTKKYYYPPNELEKLQNISEFSQPYKEYCELVHNYYLLTEDKGKKIFQEMLNWFSPENEKETIATWPNNFVVSLFRPIELDNTIYFEDIRTKEKYQMLIREDLEGDQIESVHSPFLSLLVPSDKEYMADTILKCEDFDLIDPNTTKNLSKKDWEKYIFYWYRMNLLKSVKLKHAKFEEEEANFYSAGRLSNESDFEYANRLIKQDVLLPEFPYLGKLTQLLLKVIQTFPQLLLTKVNAIPLLDAIKILFTDLDIELSAEDNYSNHQGHLWLVLIMETFPEEVKSIQRYQVDPEFWHIDY